MTLAAVRDVRLSYVNADARAEFNRAKQAQEATGRVANVITAARSAAPSAVDAMLDCSASTGVAAPRMALALRQTRPCLTPCSPARWTT